MRKPVYRSFEITSTKIIILVAVFLVAFSNLAFFSNIIAVYPLKLSNLGFLASLILVFSAINVLLLALVSFRYTIKLVSILVLLASSIAAYFMDSYNTILDQEMIRNIIATDPAEIKDLLNPKQILYFVLLGVMPSLFIYKVNIVFYSFGKEVVGRIKLIVLTLISILLLFFMFGDFYSSFFREHKQLRYYSNPGYYLYSTGRYLQGQVKSKGLSIKPLGRDARVAVSDTQRELIFFVVGETARADHFSLNGYARNTNPLLAQEKVISFDNFWSCGTSTAVSVPCMFSALTADDFNVERGKASENVLDILNSAGVNLLWLDNNSSSKGVADRIAYLDYRSPGLNTMCDVECRDEGMLQDIQAYINDHKQGDIMIVLHQMGNHGPAYYKRYPAAFERFKPVCETNQLENCSLEEINNAYDNAILYTDYFLSRAISLLKQNNDAFEASLFYVSDHGESLGENGLYLHGLPGFIAPDSQRKVPALVWFGDNYDDANLNLLRKNRGARLTHDNIFHTILGYMEIETTVYDKSLDILHQNDP